MIFGGFSDYSNGYERLRSTEIITEQGVIPGPEMPEAVGSHSVAVVNETTSIIIGGSTNEDYTSPKTWFFNHVTQQYQAGPSLIRGRNFHSSVTIQDLITMEKIVVVLGGYYRGSTELLINGKSKWQQGKNNTK